MTLEEFKSTNFYKESYFNDDFIFDNEEKWEDVSTRYDNWIQNKTSNPKETIPHIIHQLWVGSPLPDKYKNWCKSWQKKNPGWKYILWTEDNLPELFTPEEMAWFKASKNFGPKSDIFRYAVLTHIGGFYCDTDFECLKNFDYLADSCTFISGTGLPSMFEILAGLIGSTKGHPLMDQIRKDLLTVDIANLEEKDILYTTGPAFLTREFYKHKKLLQKSDIIFPSDWFYPFPNTERNKKRSQTQIKNEFLKPNTAALHYWEMSWSSKNFWEDLWIYTKVFIKKIIFFDRWRRK